MSTLGVDPSARNGGMTNHHKIRRVHAGSSIKGPIVSFSPLVPKHIVRSADLLTVQRSRVRRDNSYGRYAPPKSLMVPLIILRYFQVVRPPIGGALPKGVEPDL